MKNILKIITVFLISAPIYAGLRFNVHADKFYSDKASHKVNQDEYDALIKEIIDDFPQGFFHLTDAEYAEIFVMLKMIKSPASKQLSIDLEQILKQLKKNIKRIKALA